MKVAIVPPDTFQFDSRGRNTARSLAADGHEVIVLARPGEGLPASEILDPGVRVVRLEIDRRITSALRPLPHRARVLVARAIGLDPQAVILPATRPHGLDRLRHPVRRMLELTAHVRRVGPFDQCVERSSCASRIAPEMKGDLGQAAREAAAQFGTPVYFYDLARLRADATAIRDAFPNPWIRLYSLKANGLPGLVREILAEGFSLSAVSGGELDLGRRAGAAPSLMVLEGVGKSEPDLRTAARLAAAGTPLLWVSLESAEDAAALAAHAFRIGDRVDALVRVNPSVAPETLGALAVGAPSSKFGVLPEELPSVIEAGGGPNGPIRWRGIHLHVGSQLGAVDSWRSSFRVGLRMLELQRAELTDFDTLDAGGGFPVAYDESADSVPPAARFAAEAKAELEQLSAAARPRRLAVEPGRAVVAGCGWLIGRVLHVRRREPPIVVLDTGMTELIRPALYGARHPMVALTSLGQPIDSEDGAPMETVRVDGPVCESTDTLGTASFPPLERTDLVAIGMTGAYGSSMFSTYNGRPRPPEVAWDGGRLISLRRRGSYRALP